MLNLQSLARPLALLLVAVTLAGCTEDDIYTNPLDDFEEVLAYPADAHTPLEGGDVRVKVIEPDLGHAHTGKQRVVVAVYNGNDTAPLTDLTIEPGTYGYATMAPVMAHGCGCDEPAMKHVGHGVYISETDFIHAGAWRLDLLLTVDGQDLTFEIPFQVDAGGHEH